MALRGRLDIKSAPIGIAETLPPVRCCVDGLRAAEVLPQYVDILRLMAVALALLRLRGDVPEPEP